MLINFMRPERSLQKSGGWVLVTCHAIFLWHFSVWMILKLIFTALEILVFVNKSRNGDRLWMMWFVVTKLSKSNKNISISIVNEKFLFNHTPSTNKPRNISFLKSLQMEGKYLIKWREILFSSRPSERLAFKSEMLKPKSSHNKSHNHCSEAGN